MAGRCAAALVTAAHRLVLRVATGLDASAGVLTLWSSAMALRRGGSGGESEGDQI